MTPPEKLDVAVRGYAVPDYERVPKGGAGWKYEDPGPSRWSLVFDTETTTDQVQRLRIGTFQTRVRGRIRKAGVFFDPDVLTPEEGDLVREVAWKRGWDVMTARAFAEDVLLRIAWDRRGLIIGHNLPFDIARVAIDQRPAQSRQRSMRGAFSFRFSDDEKKSHIQIKKASAGAAFIKLTIPAGISPEERNKQRGGDTPNHHGYFADTATLSGALLGGRRSLGNLAKVLDTATQKADGDHGQELTEPYLDYAMDDVQVTYECYEKLSDRLAGYQIPKEPWEVYSEATIGKGHLSKMGLEPIPRFSPQIIATVMETYYGGRTETMIRKAAIPGVYVDFASQYPTAFVNQNLWDYMTAESIAFERSDGADAQQLLDRITIDDVLGGEIWTQLQVLVLIQPDGDRLPTRARYGHAVDPDGQEANQRAMNVGVPYRTAGPPQWWTLADAIASEMHTGKAPKVLEEIRFFPRGQQQDLSPINIAGRPDFRIDPNQDDFIKRLVELRVDVRDQQRAAEKDGNEALAAALDAAQQAMKVTANGTGYGSAIEMNVIEHRKPVSATVYLPDGTSYPTKISRSEKPGSWFNPLVATLVASGGRLMLAAAMDLVHQRGGNYVFCDTDSLFIAATKPGGPILCSGGSTGSGTGARVHALSHAEVDEVVDRFTALNPYDPKARPGSILEIEDENFDPDSGEQREIYALGLASKRYALFIYDPDGYPEVLGDNRKRRRSEHGLGHLLPPSATTPNLDDKDWIDEWWHQILCQELGLPTPEPEWFDQPAIGRLTVTNPRDLAAFKAHNIDKPYSDQVKPWGFLGMAHPTPTERGRKGGPRTLVSSFQSDPTKRLKAVWTDRNQPSLDGRPIRTDATHEYRDDTYAVASYRDYFTGYRIHPELKALAPDDRPCHPWTKGLLKPRHIEAIKVLRVGKESNRLSDEPLPVDDAAEAVIEYPNRRACPGCGARVTGRRKWCEDACRKAHTRKTRKHRESGGAQA